MLMWNWFVLPVFHTGEISFWQMLPMHPLSSELRQAQTAPLVCPAAEARGTREQGLLARPAQWRDVEDAPTVGGQAARLLPTFDAIISGNLRALPEPPDESRSVNPSSLGTTSVVHY
jgi:hypothetical protein